MNENSLKDLKAQIHTTSEAEIEEMLDSWHNGNKKHFAETYKGLSESDKIKTIRIAFDQMQDDGFERFLNSLENLL